MTNELQTIAERRGLLISGGSDFHGFNGRHVAIGAVNVPYVLLERMKTELEKRRNSEK